MGLGDLTEARMFLWKRFQLSHLPASSSVSRRVSPSPGQVGLGAPVLCLLRPELPQLLSRGFCAPVHSVHTHLLTQVVRQGASGHQGHTLLS